MRKLALLTFGIFMLSACNTNSNKSEEQLKDQPTMVGAEKDENGCLVSSGQTWSKLKQECIQVFNVGFRLNPVENEEGKAIISAFVLPNDDNSKIELFLPDDTENSVILEKVDDYIYQNDRYKYDSNKSVLYADEQIIYKGNVE